jgi:hypothetical protein
MQTAPPSGRAARFRRRRGASGELPSAGPHDTAPFIPAGFAAMAGRRRSSTWPIGAAAAAGGADTASPVGARIVVRGGRPRRLVCRARS